jgi:hypothetical protein
MINTMTMSRGDEGRGGWTDAHTHAHTHAHTNTHAHARTHSRRTHAPPIHAPLHPLRSFEHLTLAPTRAPRLAVAGRTAPRPPHTPARPRTAVPCLRSSCRGCVRWRAWGRGRAGGGEEPRAPAWAGRRGAEKCGSGAQSTRETSGGHCGT